MKTERCANCYFSRPIERSEVLSCRCNPPTITSVSQSEQGTTITSHSPLVSPDWWCGHWKDNDMAIGQSPMTIFSPFKKRQ
jgi:hypothetical protein